MTPVSGETSSGVVPVSGVADSDMAPVSSMTASCVTQFLARLLLVWPPILA